MTTIRTFGGLCLIAGLAATGTAVAAWEVGESATLRVAASQPVHAAYAVTVGFKEIVERELPGVTIDMTVTTGGIENALLIQAGELEMANGNTLGAYSVHHGSFAAEGADPFPQIVGLFPIYNWEIGTMVPADSEVNTFRDLVGKRLALGPVGSGAEATAMQTITAMGLSEADFARIQRSAPAQAFGSLAAGTVDAVIWGTAHPAGAIVEQIATRGLKFISYEQEDMDKVVESFPFFHHGIVDASLYEGVEDSALWTGGGTHFWIHTDVDEELVYRMVKAVWEHREELVERHPSQARLNEDLVRQQARVLPFHAGAERYFREIGILQ